MSRPTLSDWHVEQLRLTAFTSSTLDQASVDWWQEVTGSRPESVTTKPSLGIFTVEGIVAGSRVLLNIGPGRIDWLFVGQPSEESPVPDLGSFTDNEQRFVEKISAWLSKAKPPLQRLAVGCVLRFPVKDRIDGYRMLAELLPAVRIDIEGSSDFLYQINRPKPSKEIEGLKINRLSKWSVVTMALFAIPAIVQSSETSYCRVELDINTDKDRKSDLGKKASPLFIELLESAKLIAQGGDLQ